MDYPFKNSIVMGTQYRRDNGDNRSNGNIRYIFVSSSFLIDIYDSQMGSRNRDRNRNRNIYEIFVELYGVYRHRKFNSRDERFLTEFRSYRESKQGINNDSIHEYYKKKNSSILKLYNEGKKRERDY